jgi:HEAT repeat protein
MKALRMLTLLAGVAAAGAAVPDRAAAAPAVDPAAPRARRQDPADSLYRAAREVMGRNDYKRAATLFRQVFERYPKSTYAADARYFEAFTLYRAGATDDLRRARVALRVLQADSANVARTLRRDALSLDTRVCGELARRGDEECARLLDQRARDAGFGAAVRGAVDVAVGAAAEAMASPEIARALGEAQAAAVDAAREGARGAQEAMNSPEVRRAIADAGQQAARASADAARAAQEGLRTGVEALNGMTWSMGSGSSASNRRRNPNCRDADDDERVIALNGLQQMDGERALPLLRKVLARRDECSETLRRRAVFLVAQKKSPEVADLLVNTARNDPDPAVREEAVLWMSRVGGERSVDFLRDVARNDTSLSLRKGAVRALSQSKEPRARETLRTIATTREAAPEVRGDAIYYIGSRGDSTDAAWLRRLFPSLETRELKERAVSALARQKGSAPWLLEIARDQREPLEVRKSAFGQASRAATPAELIAMWDATKEKELRESLVLALSRRKEPEALDKLIAIARSDADRDIRKSAVYWVSRSSEPRALAFLQELIEK